MTAPQGTGLSPRGTQAPAHPRHATQAAQLPVPGRPGPSARGERGAAGAPGSPEVGAVDLEVGAVDLVGRLEGIREGLTALAPLVRDEAARRLVAAIRDVDTLLEQLRPSAAPTAPASVAHQPRGPRATGAVAGVPAVSPVPATTGGHRPPALPCGPDYPVLPLRHDG